jgi:hypothetical protein
MENAFTLAQKYPIHLPLFCIFQETTLFSLLNNKEIKIEYSKQENVPLFFIHFKIIIQSVSIDFKTLSILDELFIYFNKSLLYFLNSF